jgi:hypothetical protein
MKLNGSARQGVTYLAANIVRAGRGFRVDLASARKWDYSSRRRPERPSTAAAIRKLVIRITTDNPAYVELAIM